MLDNITLRNVVNVESRQLVTSDISALTLLTDTVWFTDFGELKALINRNEDIWIFWIGINCLRSAGAQFSALGSSNMWTRFAW